MLGVFTGCVGADALFGGIAEESADGEIARFAKQVVEGEVYAGERHNA